jgi:hypothetical protein
LSPAADGGRATREPLLDRLDRALGIHDLGGIDGNIVGIRVRERAVAIFARARLVAETERRKAEALARLRGVGRR